MGPSIYSFYLQILGFVDPCIFSNLVSLQSLFIQLSLCPLFSFPSRTPIICIIFCLMISYKFLKFCLLLFFHSSNSIISNALFSSLLILSSSCLSLLLNPSYEFFNSIIVFFNSRISVWFFFIICIPVDIRILYIYFFPDFL